MRKPATAETFWSRVDTSGECWHWLGNCNIYGYGRLSFQGRRALAHRVAYELTIGPIPAGLTLDHLCRNRSCVKPAHLEAVSQKVNILRGYGAAALAARATHCKKGHPFDQDNTRIDNRGKRVCIQCHRLKVRRQQARRRAERYAVELDRRPSSVALITTE